MRSKLNPIRSDWDRMGFNLYLMRFDSCLFRSESYRIRSELYRCRSDPYRQRSNWDRDLVNLPRLRFVEYLFLFVSDGQGAIDLRELKIKNYKLKTKNGSGALRAILDAFGETSRLLDPIAWPWGFPTLQSASQILRGCTCHVPIDY
jgi:hypothetical protein